LKKTFIDKKATCRPIREIVLENENPSEVLLRQNPGRPGPSPISMQKCNGTMPIISVITVCRNAETFIAKTMISVLEQT
jgi:hypothetical protein